MSVLKTSVKQTKIHVTGHHLSFTDLGKNYKFTAVKLFQQTCALAPVTSIYSVSTSMSVKYQLVNTL